MRQMSFESVGIIDPGCPARPAAARFRRAFVRPILTRPPIRATRPWSLLQISVKAFSHGMNTGLFTGKESLTRQKKNFPIVIILTDDKGLQHRKDCIEAGAHFIFDKTTETYKIQEVLTRLIQGNNILKDSCLFEFWENSETTV